MAKVALGFIETRGNTGIIYALDAMLKEAHVDLVDKIGIGGAYGDGRVYEQGNYVGNTSMTQLSIGFQMGGQAEAVTVEGDA